MNAKLRDRLAAAVAQFWSTRDRQQSAQGSRTGKRDYGSRGAATGGKQLDGFITLVRELLIEAGLPDALIHTRQVIIPGYFRPVKQWDLLVVDGEHLVAIIEFKSHVGPSFGNNFNNRTEEALGSATDLWTAHREGVFKESIRPWAGYFLLLEERRESTSPVAVTEPHFKVRPEFKDASYARRYELFGQRLVRERLYDAACFLLSPRKGSRRGEFTEPCDELSFSRFVASLMGHVNGYIRLRQGQSE